MSRTSLNIKAMNFKRLKRRIEMVAADEKMTTWREDSH